MTLIYPDTGFEPLIFNTTTPNYVGGPGATANAGSRQAWSFLTETSGGSMTLTFIVFWHPNPDQGGAPNTNFVVEIQTDAGAFQPLQITSGGPGSNAISFSGGSVNYQFVALATPGVYLLSFSQDSGPYDGQSWSIRFTMTKNVDATHNAGVTFVVDAGTGGAVMPWIAVPGQTGSLTASGPATIDIGAALAALALGGPAPTAQQIIAGKIYNLSVPVGNFGPGPLTITGIAPATAVNGVTLSTATPLVVPPGSVKTLSASFSAPPGGQTASPATAAAFTLACNDPHAPGDASNGHFNTITMNATAGNFEIVLALDVSGSMGATDAGGDTRWNQLKIAAVDTLINYQNFASNNDNVAIVLYPKSNSESVGDVLLPAQPIKPLNIGNDIAPKFNSRQPVDSTPMLGSPGKLGGVYLSAGDPSGVPQTDCGQFKNTADGVTFLRNFRWLILMSDGVSNVGEDAKSVFVSGGSRASYFANRNISVVSVAYGKPGGGQVDSDALNSVAGAGKGGHFISATTTGLPSEMLGAKFDKSLGPALGLNFAADPDAALETATSENRHKIAITDYDKSANFQVWCGTKFEAGAIEVELLTPLRELVTATNAAGFGVIFNVSALSRSFHVGATALRNRGGEPRHGVWTIIVRRVPPVVIGVADAAPASAAAVAPIRYAYGARVDSELTFIAKGDKPQNFAGDGIGVAAALALRGRPIADAHVVAEVAGSGAGFENWLAAQVVTEAEFALAQRKLESQGLHDLQALFIKTQALADKGVFFPGIGSSVTQTLDFSPKSGTYHTKFPAITLPGTYQFLVSATGQDESGNLFARQQLYTTTVAPKPDAESTLVSIAYQLVGTQMHATLTLWPRDRLGNVYLADPAISQAIELIISGGAVVIEPLKWNLDGSFKEVFAYPPTATPTFGVRIGGSTIIPKISPPDFSKLVFVNEVVRFHKGSEARPGANAHVDATKALGDPSKKPSTEFVSLGGHGIVEFDVKRTVVRATAVTVFAAMDSTLRSYAVEVLPAHGGYGWTEIGRSHGITQTFSLLPKKHAPPDVKDWYIEVEGRLAGEVFEVKIPLEGKLHPPEDPLNHLVGKGVRRVRIRDLSGVIANPDGSASTSPGVSLLGVGFTV